MRCLQLACERDPDSAWAEVAEQQRLARISGQSSDDPASKLANGNSASHSPVKATAAPASQGSKLPEDVRKALASAPDFGSAWGVELFGLADAGVLMRIEALPRVETCVGYVLTEQRGGWEAAQKLLQREMVKRQKAVNKVSTKVPSDFLFL